MDVLGILILKNVCNVLLLICIVPILNKQLIPKLLIFNYNMYNIIGIYQ